MSARVLMDVETHQCSSPQRLSATTMCFTMFL